MWGGKRWHGKRRKRRREKGGEKETNQRVYTKPPSAAPIRSPSLRPHLNLSLCSRKTIHPIPIKTTPAPTQIFKNHHVRLLGEAKCQRVRGEIERFGGRVLWSGDDEDDGGGGADFVIVRLVRYVLDFFL